MSNPNPATTPAPRWFCWFAAVALLGYGVFLGKYFTPAAGGSDSSGYLNAARLIASGHLTAPLRAVPGPADYAGVHVQPLGFLVELERGRIVPTYPLGLPAHFAVVSRLVGWTAGPLLVGVGAALAALWLCYLVARELGLSWPLAAVGALTLGAFPVTLFIALQPLSDVLATTWCLAAMLAALRAQRTLRWAFICGAALAVAVFVRPTNVLLLPALVVFLGHWRRIAAAALGGLPGALALAWCNRHLYGSPWRMGYGSVFEAFDSAYFQPTMLHFAHWLAVMLPAVFLLLPFAVFARGQARGRGRILIALALWFSVPVMFYAYYEVSHEVWWCLRFILPAVPALIVAALLGLDALLPRHPRARPVAAVAVSLWAIAGFWYWTAHFHILNTQIDEHGYIEVGGWARDHLPAGSVVACMADSGAIYYYTSFPIVRWDVMSADDFSRHVTAIARARQPLYLIVFPFEETRALGEHPPARWEKTAVVAGRNIWRYLGPATGAPSP